MNSGASSTSATPIGPHGKQPAARRGEPAEQRREREDQHPAEEGAAAAEDIPDPAPEQQQPAMLVQRFLGDSAPIPDEFLVAIVDDLIMPLLGHPPARRPPGRSPSGRR